MFQNTQYEERARGASISPSFSVSLSSRGGVGQMGEIKKRAVMRKIAFRFSACSSWSEGQHSHNVVEQFEFSSRRPSISLIQAMLFNMGGSCERSSEGHIHGTYVVISDWERERERGTRKGAGLAFAAPT